MKMNFTGGGGSLRLRLLAVRAYRVSTYDSGADIAEVVVGAGVGGAGQAAIGFREIVRSLKEQLQP